MFVVFGSAGGLDLGRTQRWTESEVTGLSRRPHDYFGFALAAADFDLDGRDDLAVGAFNAGIVAALYGTDGGLRLARSHVWIQNQFGSPGDWEFGYTLAAGDLGGDGAPDLAIGATRTSGSGAVVVLFSVTGGLSSDGNRVIDAASLGSTHSIEDYFGSALAIGDFDGKDGADLAIGAEFDRSGQRRTGRVYAVPRSQGELDASQALVLGPRRLGGLVGEAEIGSDLAAADLNGDGMEDLIVGAPGARVGDAKYAGSAAVVPGSEDWLDWASTRVLSADTPGMPGRAAYGDNFAYSLLADDFDGAGAAELAVGTRRAIGEERLAGSVYEVSGALDTPAGREWTQNTPGVPGVPNRLDSFGWALA